MPYCSHRGENLSEDDRYCPICGQQTSESFGLDLGMKIVIIAAAALILAAFMIMISTA